MGISRHFFSGWSPQCFEPGFAFRKAAIIFSDSKRHCRTLLQERAGVCVLALWLPYPGAAQTWTPSWSPSSASLCSHCILCCFLFVSFLSQKNSPKTSQARRKCRDGFSASVRSNDLSTLQREARERMWRLWDLLGKCHGSFAVG